MESSIPRDAASGRVRVVVATRNEGKAREFARLLGAGFAVEPLPESVVLPEETGTTFAQNARLKAVAAFSALAGAVSVLADDSGLEVDGLGGQPGVRSARFAGESASDADNVSLLLARMDSSATDRTGRFVCALALAAPKEGGLEPLIVEARGQLDGRIASVPAGSEGFGYDPVFVPDGWSVTLGEAGPREKDSVSHRARAVERLLERLRREGVIDHG
jgi:non-canonical purine NTP pyrophosphatase (RdgB/HAM1 family)